MSFTIQRTFVAGHLTPLLMPEGRGVARSLRPFAFLAFWLFCREAHAAPCTPAPAPAGLFLWVYWRVCGLLGGNVSQFCALFRLFWRKRDWNCATLPHPGDDTPPEPPRSSAQLSSLPVIWQILPRFCSSVVVDYAFDRPKSPCRNNGSAKYFAFLEKG